MGSVIAAHWLSCPVACGNLSRPGVKPVSPVLEGRVLTTGPPGKSYFGFFLRPDTSKIKKKKNAVHRASCFSPF